MEYHVLWKGARYGPYSAEQLEEMLNLGQVGSLHAIYEGETLITAEDFLAAVNQRRQKVNADSAQQRAISSLKQDNQRREQENLRLQRQLEQQREQQQKPVQPPKPPERGASTSGGIAVARNGATLGQFSLQEIQTGLVGGRFLVSDTAWNAALSTWIPIQEIVGGIHPKNQRTPSNESIQETVNQKNIMNTSKQEYVLKMRATSAYPIFRQIVRISAMIFFVLAALVAFGSIVGGIVMLAQKNEILGYTYLLGGVFYGAIIAVSTIFWRDLATILADAADSLINLAHRNDQD